MKLNIRTSIIAIAVITLLSASFFIVSGTGKSDSESKDKQGRTLEGVWRTAVTFRNCQTGVPLPIPPLSDLFTFHSGGTLTEYANRPNPTTPARGPGHGLWEREHGWQDHSFKFIFNRYSAAGEFIGTQEVRGTLELGAARDDFTTSATIQVFDASGNLINSGCTTSVGMRFE